MRKLSVCLFYGLCVFTIVFSLFWMALPKLPLSQSPAGSETDPASPLSLAAQAVPQTDTARYCLQDSGGRVAVYTMSLSAEMPQSLFPTCYPDS